MTPTQIAISVSICVHGVVFGLVWFGQAPSPAEPTVLNLEIVAAPQSRAPSLAKSAAPHFKSSTKTNSPRVTAEPNVASVNSDSLPEAAAIEQPAETTSVAAPNHTSDALPNDTSSNLSNTSPPSRQQEAVVTPPSFSLGARLTPKPIYPELAQQRNQSGKVVVHAWVNEKGEPIPAKLKVISSSGYPLLDDAAVRCVLRWRFNPARLGDVAVLGDVQVTLVFDKKDAE